MYLLQIYLTETVQEGMLSFLLDKITMCVHCHGKDLCDYSDAFIDVKGTVTAKGCNDAKTNKKLISKIMLCISKINKVFIDNAEDLDIVLPMYNLLEYSDNCSLRLGSLWNYYRDGINDGANENNTANDKINNSKAISKSFQYKTIGGMPNNNNLLDTRCCSIEIFE